MHACHCITGCLSSCTSRILSLRRISDLNTSCGHCRGTAALRCWWSSCWAITRWLLWGSCWWCCLNCRDLCVLCCVTSNLSIRGYCSTTCLSSTAYRILRQRRISGLNTSCHNSWSTAAILRRWWSSCWTTTRWLLCSSSWWSCLRISIWRTWSLCYKNNYVRLRRCGY